MFVIDFINNIKTENDTLNLLAAYGLYELFKGIAFELSSIIFKGDSVNIPGLNIDININRFMKHIFIFLFIVLLIILYKDKSNKSNKISGGRCNKKKKVEGGTCSAKKKIKFVKK
mgnify:CR=1 FL=1|jgi:hypothetical protein